MTRWKTKPASLVVLNERAKAVAGLLFNLGAALAAATAVKVYADAAFDVTTVLWSAMTAVLIYLGWLTLSLIEEERTDGYDHADIR